MGKFFKIIGILKNFPINSALRTEPRLRLART